MRTAQNLLFHYVSEGRPERRLTVSRAGLAAIVEAELADGHRAAALADYLDEPPGPECFTISFDDAHSSVLAHAAPVLRALGVRATLFVPTGYVGTSDELLDWDDLRRLRDEGWELGSHAHTHPRMGFRLYDETDDDHARRLLEEELLRSRERMERELGAAPRLFAYPYGEAPALARRMVEQAGFEAAFTVDEACTWNGDPFAIPRTDATSRADEGPDVMPGDEPVALSVVVPAFDRVRILSDVVTRLASQSYPRERFEVVVVDDGSNEDLGPIFREMPSNVRLVHQGDRRFRAGQARQRGAIEARHPYLVFLDADVAVGPDFLWHLDWVHRRVPDALVLGYLSGYNLHDLGQLHTPAAVTGADLATLALIPDRSREPTLRSCLDNLDWLADPWPLTYTGNVSVPRALFDRVGGFADEFVGWGLEDVDLGVRLSRAGARFVFARFAHGVHIVDPDEPMSRNPFRAKSPAREDFAGYLTNLEILRRRHASDPAVQRYVERSLADIAETCGRPMTVGIEMGGESRVRTSLHRRLHRLQPGGVPLHELLDRVAYAAKVQARTIYLLGGEPVEHPSFFRLLASARAVVRWISAETMVHPFAEPGLAERAHDEGLSGVVATIFALDGAAHEAVAGKGTYAELVRGLDALEHAGLEIAVHLVVTRQTAEVIEPTLSELRRRGLALEGASVTDPSLAPAVERATGFAPRVC